MNDAEKEVIKAINALYLEAPESVVDSVKEIVFKSINTKQDEIERLTARNKELEKSEKAFLETINQQGDEIKELESKIAVAREALEHAKDSWRITCTHKTGENCPVFLALAELGENINQKGEVK